VGPPLGIGWRGPRSGAVAALPSGSTLLLFTDGLFERRGEPLDEGRRRVAEAVSRRAAAPLAQLCDGLLDELTGGGVEDDVAVLAVRAHPEAGPRPPEAGPELLPPSVR
jgi:serine phosphatase RsbU (regulator of sigma subunit)